MRRAHESPRRRRAVRNLGVTLLLLPMLAGPAGALAQQSARESEAWTPALSMKYFAIRGTALSPDGRQVAYVVREPIMEGKKSEYRSQIWVASADGSRNVQFTRGEKSSSNPSFSPDGRWLAFTSARPTDGKPGGEKAKSQVWLLPLAGGEARPATRAESGVEAYRWSPDGTRIAYTMRDPKTKEEKKAEEEKRDVILVDRNFKDAHLYVVPVDPGAEEPPEGTRLTAGSFHVTGFDWSPDGARIAFAHQSDPRLNTRSRDGDLSTVAVPADLEAAGEPGAGIPLVTGAGVESDPRFSPDGRWVAFVSTGKRPEPVGLGDLYVVPAEGGEPRALPLTPDRAGGLLGWSGDGREVFVSQTLHTTRHVLAVPVDGGEVRQVSSGDGVVGSVSFTPSADEMAFTWQTTDTPWDVYVSPTARYAPSRVTDIHAEVPRPRMGRTELLSWTAPDGTPVEGLLTYPVDYEKGRRVPLILNVHGGPAGAFVQSFTGAPSVYMLQYFAQRGFAILRANP
ncbi:MAG: LpqB family beta-propeller domain-containing protein, partial [Gemmatimonadota bacterium]